MHKHLGKKAKEADATDDGSRPNSAGGRFYPEFYAAIHLLQINHAYTKIVEQNANNSFILKCLINFNAKIFGINVSIFRPLLLVFWLR